MSGTIEVAETADGVDAAIWAGALRDAGIKVGVYERGHGAALGGAMTMGLARHVLVVPGEQAGAARSVIAEFGGTGALLPIRDAASQRAGQAHALRTVLLIVGVIVLLGLAFALVGR